MTLLMYLLAHGAQTPVMMWLIAMLCDTAIIITVLLTKVPPT